MQFHMGLQHRHGGAYHLGDVDVSGDSLSILVRASFPFAVANVRFKCMLHVYTCVRMCEVPAGITRPYYA